MGNIKPMATQWALHRLLSKLAAVAKL